MEPVNIDFMLGGNVEQEAPKIEKNLDDIVNAGKKAVQGAKEAVQEQKTVIQQIEADIKKIEAEMSKAAPGNAKMQLTQELNAAKQALNEEKAALGDYAVKVDQAAESNVRLRTQVMNAKQALDQMAQAGLRGTETYSKQQEVLGGLQSRMNAANKQARVLGDPEGGMHAATQTVTGMAGAFTAATGAMSLFAGENEDMARIQMRLQAVMAITIGLTQAAEMLNKNSYFSLKILVPIKEAYAAAELKAAAAMGVSTVAARTLMATLTLGLSLAIVAIIYLYDKWTTKQDELKKKQAEVSKFQEELRKSISEGYAEEQSKIQAMRTALDSENISRDKKLGIIKQLKDQIPGYTAQLDAEGNIIRENKRAIDDYMISLEKSLKFRAAEKELAAIYEKIYNMQKLLPKEGEKTGTMADNLQKPKSGNFQFKSSAINENIKTLQDQADLIKKYISGEGLFDPGKDKKDKAEKQEFDAAKAFQKEILSIHDQTSKLLIQQQEDSLQKRLAEIDLEKELEIQKIREKEVAIIEAYNKSHKDDKGFKSLSTKPGDINNSLSTIDPNQAKTLNDEELALINAYGAKKVAATDKWTQELLTLATKYGDERTKIEEEYDKRIQKLAENGFTVQATQEAEIRDKKISAVSTSLMQETDLYKMATGKQLQISKELTAALIAELEKRIEADQTINSEDADKMLAKLHQADYTVQRTDNPFADLIDGVEKYKAAREKQSKTNAQDDLKGFVLLEDAANKAQKATLEAAAGALQGIGSIISEVVNTLDSLGTLSEADKKTANEVIGIVSGAANLAQGLATGNPVAIITGSVQLLTNAFQLFDVESKKIADRIAADQAALDKLTAAYERLEVAIKSSYSTEKASLLLKEREILEKDIELKKDQLAAEQQKQVDKNNASNGKGMLGWLFYLLTPGTDDNKVTQLNEDITKLGDQISENKDKLIEALTGTTVSSAIDDFANAYADAFTTGEDAAAKSTDVIYNIFKAGLLDKLKEKLQPQIQDLMLSIANAMSDESDGGSKLTDAEKAAILAKKNALDNLAANYQQEFQDLGLNTSAAKGISGDVKNMTEDTGSALVGQIIAMRLNVAEIVSGYKNSAEIMTKQLALQQEIADNTAFCRKLERMDNTLEYIRINGIKVV